MQNEVLFTRSQSVAEEIDRLLRAARASVDAALYRIDNPRLAQALNEAAQRGLRTRLVIDRGKFEASLETRSLLASSEIAFRLSNGRGAGESKMHHKFAVVDQAILLAGSYNWTLESEVGNYENLVILRDPLLVEAYTREFEALWTGARGA